MGRGGTKTVVITGASRGIGEATAKRLAEPGMEMILLARSEDKLDSICKEISHRGVHADYLVTDLSTVDVAREAARKIAERCEAIDILVLNAGMSNDKPFEEASLDEIVYELGVNYLAPVSLLHTLLPQLKRRRSHVIVIGSLTAILPFPSNATYAASKAPLLSLIKSLRLEMRGEGIHFGIVLPGLTNTAATEQMTSRLPRATPEKIAEAIVECIADRKGLVIPGVGNRIAAAVFQQFPGLGEKMLTPFRRRLIPGYDDHVSK